MTITRYLEPEVTSVPPLMDRQTITMSDEEKKLKNAMMRDRKMQEERYSRDVPAHIIINDYRRGAQSKEQTIYLLHINCAKSRATSLLILDKSGADDEHKRSLATLQMEEQMLLVMEGRYICR